MVQIIPGVFLIESSTRLFVSLAFIGVNSTLRGSSALDCCQSLFLEVGLNQSPQFFFRIDVIRMKPIGYEPNGRFNLVA